MQPIDRTSSLKCIGLDSRLSFCRCQYHGSIFNSFASIHSELGKNASVRWRVTVVQRYSKSSKSVPIKSPYHD